MVPQAKPFEIRDTELKGFILRVQPSGIMSYICQYARGKRITLGSVNVMMPVQAREKARDTLAQYVTTRADPMEIRKAERTHTLESFVAEKYKPWVESNLRRADDTLSKLKSWYPALGNNKLADIKAWDVERQRAEWLKAGSAPITVNHKIKYLKAALNKAIAWGLLQSNPLESVKLSKVDNAGIVRYLTNDEDNRLRAALDTREESHREKRKHDNQWRAERGYEPLPEKSADEYVDNLKPLVLLALNTGMRRGELFNLKWADIDFLRKILTVQGATAKSGKTRHIPLSNEAVDVLTRCYMQSQGTEFVFQDANGDALTNISFIWSRLMKAAQIEKFRFHDCRHTFASRLVMKGVDLNTVRELLGHSTIEMTLRYAHLAPEKLAAAINMLNAG